jgi:transposase
VERARVILLAAAGKQDREIAAEIGISNQKAARWRKRFLKSGLAGPEKDAPRPGRTPSIPKTTVDRVVQLTTLGKPYNVSHWSTRMMSAESGISEAGVRRIWRGHGLKPHFTFKISKDPHFAETAASPVLTA